MRKYLTLGAFLLLAACGRPAAQVEKVEICTEVGDYGMLVDAIEITVANPRSLKGLKAEDFDLMNNTSGAFIDAATGKAAEAYEDDGIVLSRKGNVLRVEAKPFGKNGRTEDWFQRVPWELRCAVDSALNVTPEQVSAEHIAVLDDCEKGSFSFGGLTREYMLHLPKDADGKVDGSRLFCAGASSGGGCTLRFMMQFPERFKAAIPCCAMDPIVPIHKVDEKYPGQFADDVEKAWKGNVVYKWNGSEMVLGPMDVEAFVKLPMYFVHAETDNTCKVASTYAYSEARKRLGAKEDKVLIYSDEDLIRWGVSPMMAHFSWVPLLDDYSEGSPMQWLVAQFE